MEILEIDHVQLAMPAGGEKKARAFYAGILELTEIPKPPNLAKRGGAWFGAKNTKIHLGVEAEFHPARKAHPAFRVQGLKQLRAKLEAGDYPTIEDEPLAGYQRFYVNDPFGNRIECLEPDEASR
jgi:catechol 2,3-dioxygenase-like lactoylglutathione lyase family enzyme